MSFEIMLEDVPKEQRDIAEAVGMEAFIKLSKLCGGQASIYITRYTQLSRGARNRTIKERYNGYNIRQLAREYNLTSRQIRKIVTAEGTKKR